MNMENSKKEEERVIERGDVYFVNLGYGTGCEQGGKRPCVVVQNNIGNIYAPTVIVIPLTTKTKKKLPTHCVVHNNQFTHETIAMAEQIRVVDKRRLYYYKCSLNEEDMKALDIAMMIAQGIVV